MVSQEVLLMPVKTGEYEATGNAMKNMKIGKKTLENHL